MMPHYVDLVRAVIAAVAFVALYPAHMVGDHWTQTSHQSSCKGLAGELPAWLAHWNCAKHVLTYEATAVVFLTGAVWWLHLPVRPGWMAAGLLVSAVTHYVADLRTPLRWIAKVLGKRRFYELVAPGMSGAYILDQSWHIGWLFVSALLIAGPPAALI